MRIVNIVCDGHELFQGGSECAREMLFTWVTRSCGRCCRQRLIPEDDGAAERK